MQMPKRKRYQKDSAPADDILTLIQLVRQNPAIYNYKLQPHRRRVDVLSGWTQIAAQIGNKYTVEECRRKWKNLRDTYHQYRLRKSKLGDSLSKWRYAKDLEFLSNVYQPKLKSQRKQNYDINSQILQVASCSDTNTTHNSDEILGNHSHSSITLVNEDAETFILTAYEEGVNDDVTTIDQATVLTHHTHADDIIESHIVKSEHGGSLDGVVDDDVATSAEVDYEEVCLYEEAANAPCANECETIISDSGNCMSSHDGGETKAFEYIDANDFCIDALNAHTQLHNCGETNNSSIISTTSSTGNSKLKSIMGMVTSDNCESNEITAVATANSMDCTSMAPLIQFQSPISAINSTENGHVREELDLFFDFLKKKIQHFSKEEISTIQIDILNCVLRREAESAQKFANMANGRSQ